MHNIIWKRENLRPNLEVSWVFFPLLLFFLLTLHPAWTVPNRAYITNFSDGTISVIDTSTNELVTTIVLAMGSTPSGIAITPDGTRAYISAGDTTEQVDVLDTATNTLLTAISPISFSKAIAISSDGKSVYVVDESFTSFVSVIDTNLNTISTTIPFPPFTSLIDIATAPNSKKVYATGSGEIWIIENNMLIGTIPLPLNSFPFGIAFSPDGNRAYASDSGNQTVLVIDAVNDLYVTSIALPMDSNPSYVAITPDGTHAFVTNNANSTVAVINTEKNMLETLVLIPTSSPWAIAITPDGLNAYLTDISSNNAVWVINTVTKAIIGPLAVGTDPDGIAITPAALPPPAPTNLSGKQQIGTNSGFEKEFVNIVRWTANPLSSGIVGYFVARDGNTIATLNASTFEYIDHNQKKGASVSYTVTSFTSDGRQSAPITIVIN
jgi:YVTN family beta-propeller protein